MECIQQIWGVLVAAKHMNEHTHIFAHVQIKQI